MRDLNESLLTVIILTAILLILPTHFCAESAETYTAKTSTTLSWEQVEQILNNRSFKSQEELFQLFHILYLQKRGESIIIEKETIIRLDQQIKTLFPLAECNSISMHNSKVTFEFVRPQDFTIPNTWRQASLQTPAKLILQISEPEAKNETASDISSLHFKVEEGYIKIDFSFLLRLFSGKLRDADGSELIYQIDNQKRISRLSLIEIFPLGNAQLRLLPFNPGDDAPDYHWLDVIHPDFPKKKDIGFSKNRISYLGIEAELLPDNMVSINGKDRHEDELSLEYFSAMITTLNKYDKTGSIGEGVIYTRAFSYHFEERQMHLSMSFKSDHDPK